MMHKQTDKIKTFSRRTFILLIIKLGLTFVLLVRLFYLQILRFKTYQTRADSNRIKSFIIPPLRGIIKDRFGAVLANNISHYRILYNPEGNVNINILIDKLSNILEMRKEEFFYVYKKYERRSSDGYLLIHDNLTWEQIAKIEVNAPDLPGIIIDTAQRRYYPFAEYISPTLGFVSMVNSTELTQGNKLLEHPDFKIGKTGIEKSFENYLRGKAGLKHVEVDAHGYTVRTLELASSKTATLGSNLDLSIDIELQQQAYDILKDKSGSAIILDIETGEILSMCSTPSFDPNPLVVGINQQEWNQLINNQQTPLLNKPVSSLYPPGSIFKTMVALAALKHNIDPSRMIKCNGKTRLGKRTYHCWKEKGHGKVNLVDAIKESCNIYFYNISKEIGIDNIVEIARLFGLGESPILPLPNIRSGLLPTKEWKKKTFKEPWVVGDTFNSAIGQGFIQVSNMQLAIMTARLASLGKKVVPTLLKNSTTPQFENIGLPEEHLRLVLEGMYKVVNEKKGTAYWQRIKDKKYLMAGKTGTAQVVSIDHNNKAKQDEIDYKKRNHGLFIGFAPYHKPKFAISVIVEHGGSGSGAAAPIGRSLLYAAQKKYL